MELGFTKILMELDFRKIFLANFISSIIVISAVFILQYNFKLPPCDMCIKERYPYYILIIISLFFLLGFNGRKSSIILSTVSIISISVGTFYTMYHIGIERNLIKGMSACSSIIEISNTSDLLNMIKKTPIIRCDEPTLVLQLISLAELNLITMSILLILNLTFIIHYVRKR